LIVILSNTKKEKHKVQNLKQYIIILSILAFSIISVHGSTSNNAEFGTSSATERIFTGIRHDSIVNPRNTNLYVHYFGLPQNTQKTPVIFFCHGITATDPSVYESLISHIVRQGYSVIYSTYETASAMINPMSAYRVMWSGFEAGVLAWNDRIDTSRIGTVGHSYGGGATPWITRRAMLEKKWGKNASFMFIMAPWYVHGLSQRNLEQFPSSVKMIIEVYEDDCINDHRMGKDLFLNIGIPDSEKSFITIRSDIGGAEAVVADHDVPLGNSSNGLYVNALDTFAIYRLLDSLAQYALTGSETAKETALKDNAFESNYVGEREDGRPLVPMLRESEPEMKNCQSVCVNFWYHSMNSRLKLFRRLKYPVRLAVSTPVTMWNYCLFATKLASR
jgi:hypothetical protein